MLNGPSWAEREKEMKITQKQLNSAMRSYRMGLDGICMNDAWNKANFGITMAEYSAILDALHEEYGLVTPRAPSLQRVNARLQQASHVSRD